MIESIHHVSLIVGDTRASLAFYQGVLGLALDAGRPDLDFPGAWLRVGDQQIHLLEVPNPDPVAGRPWLGGRDRHLALRVSDLEWVCGRLDAASIPYSRSRSGRPAVFCRDPDANTLELVQTD